MGRSEAFEVAVLVIVFAGCPTAEHDALPFEGQRADRFVVAVAVSSQHGEIVSRPAGLFQGAAGIFVKRLSQEFGAGPAHLDDARLAAALRSEEHTSELQSRFDLVCRLLLEKK